VSVLDIMKQRSSVRKFEDRPVEERTLRAVLEAARVAPSACNRQPWHFVVVRDASLKAELFGGWIAEAPAAIVVCGDHGRSWRRRDGKDHCDIDLAIAVDHITLAAVEHGLGTCWVCSFDAFAVSRGLKLPEHVEPAIVLPIGYPVDKGDPARHDAKRKKLDEIVSWDAYPSTSGG